MARTFGVRVNGEPREVPAEPDDTLLDVLRGTLDLKGTRFGCGLGQCGSCFVLLDARPVAACDTPMWAVDGKDVVTVEGLSHDGEPHPLLRAFLAEQAAQCGYCVSGILVSAAALLEQNPSPDEAAVVEALDRNLCRCGAHRRMVRAVLRAAAHAAPEASDRAGPGGAGVEPERTEVRS